MRGTRVAALRQRLRTEGLLPQGGDAQNDLFDTTLELAVGAFQRRIGLEADGIAGPLTLEQLNRSAADLKAQLRANLERWRWLPENLGSKHVRVNIAEFRLEAWADGVPVRSHDTIVGRSYRKTPVFSDNITFVVFNPWWETPRNIARLDKLPAFKTDPASVDRLGYEIFDLQNRRLDPATINWNNYSSQHFPFRIRQKPGPENALGSVKIMFPNRHNVYLHDTPARELFRKSRRDFSSGCIRVESIKELVEWILADTLGWQRAKIDTAVASGQELRVNLAQKIPIHILYTTAVRTIDGNIRFLPDIYNRDRPLIAALNERSE
jgi:murein L,D-transpeptidase YcbB/YkuD